MKDRNALLPWLWVFMIVNYLYCDVVSLFDPTVLRNIVAEHPAAGAVQMTPETLLAAALLMEIPMAMIMVSRVAARSVSRWANVVAAAFMIVVQVGSLFVGTPAAYYVFFSLIEVGSLAVIAAIALRWQPVPPVSAAVPLAPTA